MKPLNKRAYGSIPHLHGSRKPPSDKGLSKQQSLLFTERPKHKTDRIIVQEKLDGSCCAVAKIDNRIYALSRAGYEARTSPFELHHRFADWVDRNLIRFEFLNEGERVVGEWLAMAHGTIYKLQHEPFVAFDIMTGNKRLPVLDVMAIVHDVLPTPAIIHHGPLSIDQCKELTNHSKHGAEGPAEGAVYRYERGDEVIMLAKYVRHDKVDGVYLPEQSGKEAVWLA